MSYRIAAIDVHKKMLAVVVADVAGEGEYQFERRKFGATPDQLHLLAQWLCQQEVEEVVMESTTALETATPEAGGRKPEVGNSAFGTGAIQSRTAGTQEGFRRC